MRTLETFIESIVHCTNICGMIGEPNEPQKRRSKLLIWAWSCLSQRVSGYLVNVPVMEYYCSPCVSQHIFISTLNVRAKVIPSQNPREEKKHSSHSINPATRPSMARMLLAPLPLILNAPLAVVVDDALAAPELVAVEVETVENPEVAALAPPRVVAPAAPELTAPVAPAAPVAVTPAAEVAALAVVLPVPIAFAYTYVINHHSRLASRRLAWN